MPEFLYAYVWRTSRGGQIRICLLIALVTPLSMAPLELLRRIVDHAIVGRRLGLLALLAAIYLAVVLVQGALKYGLNLAKGRVLEEVARDLRSRILGRPAGEGLSADVDEGTVVSMLAAEAEDVGGFASESLAVPLLQAGTMAWVLGYLVWVEPLIAGLAIVVYAPQAILVPAIQKTINRLARDRTALVRRLGHYAVAAAEPTAAAAGRRHRRRAAILVGQIFRVRLLVYRRKYFLTFLGNLLDALGPIVVLGAGGWLVVRGGTDIGTLVVFISGFQSCPVPGTSSSTSTGRCRTPA